MEAWIKSTRLRRELTEVLTGLEQAQDLPLIYDGQGEPTIVFEEAVRILEGEPVPVTASS